MGDIAYGVRRLLQKPGFAAVSLLSLALGIGANTAVFQVVNAVRLRSLPVPEPQELVEIDIAGGNGGFGRNTGWNSLTFPMWEQVRAGQQAFSGAFAWARTQMVLGEGDGARPVEGAWVTGEAFATLGVTAQAGRLLGAADDQPGCTATAVIGDGLWRRDFGASSAAIGAELFVRGRPVTVVGVAPPDFFGVEVGRRVEVFMPFCALAQWTPGILAQRDLFFVGSMARLADGWTADRAAAHLETAGGAWLDVVEPSGYEESWMQLWDGFRLTATARPNGTSMVRDTYGASLWFLLGLTGLVLLIACSNVANLLLARTSTRSSEVAVRMAIGASRVRVLWQLFWEALVLAVGGAFAGVWLASVLSRALVTFVRSQAAFVDLEVPLDSRVLGFVVVLTIVICVGFALATGLLATGVGRTAWATSATRDGQGDRGRLRFQRPLITAQVAVSLMLVVASGLFTRSFVNLLTRDAGFQQEGIAFHRVNLGGASMAEGQPALSAALEVLGSSRAVESSATSTHVPLSGSSFYFAMATSIGREGGSQFMWVSPGYFDVMGIELRSGRDVGPADDAESTQVVVVNESFVRRFFAGRDPLGQVVRSLAEPGYPEVSYEVVGVVEDTRYLTLVQETPPIAYAPAAQAPETQPSPMIVTRSSLPLAEAAAVVESALADASPGLRAVESVDLRARAVEGMARERMLAWIAGFFGLLALGLAAIGLYGVVSCVVEGRRGEIGIRMALGASRPGVAWMVLRQIALLVVVGLTLGTGLVLGFSDAAGSLLIDLEPTDPLTLAASAGLLLCIGLWAALVPARRASRLDPRTVLSQ